MFRLQKANQKVIYTATGFGIMRQRQKNQPRCPKLEVLALRMNLHFFFQEGKIQHGERKTPKYGPPAASEAGLSRSKQ